MSWIQFATDLFLHLDKHLGDVVSRYGVWSYAILFLIIFCETGLVFTPFLPGDSLLFAAGALAGAGSLNLSLAFLLLSVAAILGDTVNYAVGKYLGHRLVGPGRFRVKQEHLDRTHAFFEKYGGKTIIIARFVPIVRTIAPFVAGLGAMTYARFVFYNVVGGIAWVAICLGAGRAFGEIPLVKQNFSLVVLAIVFISIVPAIIEFLRVRRAGSTSSGSTPR
ncbi:MAG: DedA family protein [Phycisphaerae bacterium]